MDYGPRSLWNVSLVDGGGWDRCVGIMKIEPPVSLGGREREIVKKRREKIERSEGCQTRARETSGKRAKNRWAVGM